MMTAKELIKILRRLPKATVIVDNHSQFSCGFKVDHQGNWFAVIKSISAELEDTTANNECDEKNSHKN